MNRGVKRLLAAILILLWAGGVAGFFLITYAVLFNGLAGISPSSYTDALLVATLSATAVLLIVPFVYGLVRQRAVLQSVALCCIASLSSAVVLLLSALAADVNPLAREVRALP